MAVTDIISDERYFTAVDFMAIAGHMQKYCDVAAKNICLLKAKNLPPSAGYAAFEEFDLGVVREAHCKDGPDGKKHLVLGVSDETKFHAVHLDDSLRANEAMHTANLGMKLAKAGDEKLLAVIGPNLDAAYVTSAFLREAYRYVAEMELAGLRKSGIALAKAGQSLEGEWKKRFNDIGMGYAQRALVLKTEIVAAPFNPEIARAAFAKVRMHFGLRWLAFPEHPGAKVINDVWLPAYVAKPIMERLAAAQAEALGDEMAARRAAEQKP